MVRFKGFILFYQWTLLRKHMRVNGMSVLGIDLEKNQSAMKEFITQ